MIHVGAPQLKHNGRLLWPFGEDSVTAAYELVKAARPGPLSVRGVDLPPWWWKATGCEPGNAWHLEATRTSVGPIVVLTDESMGPLEPLAMRALGNAKEIQAEEFAAIQTARDPTPRACDQPLGAHVTHTRHDEVLLSRLGRTGTVASWTVIGPGAAPSEFERLQEAQGAYTVVLIRTDQGATVGLWEGPAPKQGQAARPVVRRLFLREGAWRHGVVFAPSL